MRELIINSGWTTSAKLRQVLINFVARELNSTYKAIPTPSTEAIEAAIKTGFNRLDHEIVHESVEKVLKSKSRTLAAEALGPALSGSCALLSFYDSDSKLLRVACTGDSRAVLGRRGDSGKWVATQLSVDQTGSNPDEEARMRKQHPGEEHVIRNGRVLGGLEPTRAFGDASYKWSREISERLKQSFFGRTPSTLLKTPPYVTAEPVVTTTKIEPDKGDFVVMATDGLWEMLTNEEVVGLVGQWIEKQANDTNGNGASSWIKMFSSQQKGLPVEQGTSKKEGKGGQKTPIRQQQWGVKGGELDRFVVEDKNVATHLVRNALGGKDRDMVCALLTLPAPFSRRYRYVSPLFFLHLPFVHQANYHQGRFNSRSHLLRQRRQEWRCRPQQGSQRVGWGRKGQTLDDSIISDDFLAQKLCISRHTHVLVLCFCLLANAIDRGISYYFS